MKMSPRTTITAYEQLQEAVARKFGFRLTSHKMELYGLCAACQQKRAAKA